MNCLNSINIENWLCPSLALLDTAVNYLYRVIYFNYNNLPSISIAV